MNSDLPRDPYEYQERELRRMADEEEAFRAPGGGLDRQRDHDPEWWGAAGYRPYEGPEEHHG